MFIYIVTASSILRQHEKVPSALFQKTYLLQLRTLFGFWGLGSTPTSSKSVSVYTDALLAKMHGVDTHALLATIDLFILKRGKKYSYYKNPTSRIYGTSRFLLLQCKQKGDVDNELESG
jgi:hypothetical protein